MAYTVEWIIPKHVIRVRIVGQFEGDDLREVSEAVIVYLEQADAGHKVHLIVDLAQFHLSPMSPGELRRFIPAVDHPAFGWVITLPMSPFVTYVVRRVAYLVRFKLQSARSEAEALRFLRLQDATIPGEPG